MMSKQSKTLWGPVQFSQLCPTLCDPMDCSTPGLPVHHQLPELVQTHVQWVGDTIQSSHPLPSPFPPAFNISSITVFSNESVLCIRWPKYWNFSFSIVLPMNIQDLFPLGLTGFISLQSKGLASVFSNTTVQKHQFFSSRPSLWSNPRICTWLLENHSFACTDLCQQSDVSAFYYTV